MPSVFLSHSTSDKPVVRKIAERLSRGGIRVWIDEAEIRVGESLIQKIGEAIEETDFVAAVISQSSVNSAWVQKELSLAMTKEIKGRRIVVLPILIEQCDLPFFLSDKLYANLASPEAFETGCAKILQAVWGLEELRTSHEAQQIGATRESIKPQKSMQAETVIGTRPMGPQRAEDAFTALRNTKSMKEAATVSIGGGLSLMVLVFVVGIFLGFPSFFTVSLIIAAGFLAMSGTMAKLSAALFERALHNDANLLLALENTKGFYVPFGPTWRKQYRLGQHNRSYRLGLCVAASSLLLQFAALVLFILASVVGIPLLFIHSG